ncbi:MAG TPA: hypothetical protein VN455_03220 [Methanotrichaceae archaeon]|nr:hypothetical protein [Methanotrichaceae archaeon]
MPGFLMHLGAKATCPHVSGQVAVVASNPRVFVMGVFQVATLSDIQSIAGCLFQIPVPGGTKPQPCVLARFAPASRVLVNGQPAVLAQVPAGPSPPGVCQSVEQIPQGPPIINSVQTRVMGM